MSSNRRNDDRRISARVEEILTGWYRLQGGKFVRCKTLDLSLHGALLVLDSQVADGTEFELHLDMDAEWSVGLDAEVLWQRPIFFGKQQLTSVKYDFKKSQDRSMFGLWLQRRISSDAGGKEKHTAPVVLSEPKPELQPSIERAPRLNLVESRWKRTLSQLTAKIPWTDTEPLPQERRREARGQVGLRVSLEGEGVRYLAEFLNVSLSGAGLFLPAPEKNSGGKLLRSGPRFQLDEGQSVELVLPESSILIGGSRCKAEIVWKHKAELKGAEEHSGLVLGLKFPKPAQTRRSFVGDLLKRLNYNVRQVRSELRFPREVPVLVTLPGGEEHDGTTLDISLGGARICLSVEVATPCNVTISLELGIEGEEMCRITLSSRLLRSTVDKYGRTCYAVAFRKGQSQEHLELSRWLAGQLPMQGLGELIPNFTKGRVGEEE